MTPRERAEALFQPTPAHRPAPLQLCSFPPELQKEFDDIPLTQRQVAFKIALGPTLEARQRIWMEVPGCWRADVKRAVFLTMGALIGAQKPWAAVEQRLHDVPADLVAGVRKQALRVYEMGLPARSE